MSVSQGHRNVTQIGVGSQEFRIDGQAISIYSGAVHYWRLDRDKWHDILDKIKGLGFNTVSIYMPWEVHEIERGKFDFGEIDPRKDLDAFLTLCEEKGLRIIARPGPQINSELTWFGYPARILDDPDMQAHNAQGSKAVLTQVPRPIPAVSYASEKFFEEAGIWLDAICGLLARHKHPDGGLIAAQVDNEMAFFFHINPYACDFSPASVRLYRLFIEKKYGTLEAAGPSYTRRFASFDRADPPRSFDAKSAEDLPYYMDWIEYRERYLVDCLKRLAEMMKAKGLNGIPLFHNYPHPLGPGGAASGITAPYNLMALEECLDFVGFDIYSRKELYDHVKTVVSYVVGSSRFPYIPEFIAGVWPWYLNPGEVADEAFVTRAALMHGIKGFSRYMLVERDRWLASPIRRDGRVRPENAEMFRSTNALATRYDLKQYRRNADVLLLANRDYDRLEAASVLISYPGDFLESMLSLSEYPNSMNVSEQTFGFGEPIQLAKSAWFSTCYRDLSTAGYTFLLSDTYATAERLSAYKAVVLSSFEYMDSGLQRKLLNYAQEGGTVVLGPRVPHLDAHMRTDETLSAALAAAPASPDQKTGTVYSLGKGKLVLVDDVTKLSAALDAALNKAEVARVSKNDPRLDVAIHSKTADAQSLIVWVANPTAETVEARIGVGKAVKSVTEIWEDRPVRPDGETWSDTLAPYTIKTYTCAL